MPQPPLQAWYYELGLDRHDGVEFVFARSRAGAANLAAKALGIPRGQSVEVTRAVDFDKYGTSARVGGVEDADRFAEGWPVACWDCEHHIDSDEPCWRCAEVREEEGLPELDDANCLPVVSGNRVFCSHVCLERFEERCTRIKDKKATATAALLKRAPFVRVLGASVGAPGECVGPGFQAILRDPPNRHPRKSSCFDQDHENVMVRFKVPGGNLSELMSDDNAFHNVFCFGCGRIWVAKGDTDAYLASAMRVIREIGESAKATEAV
jgi:hypothetical protein